MIRQGDVSQISEAADTERRMEQDMRKGSGFRCNILLVNVLTFLNPSTLNSGFSDQEMQVSPEH